MPGVSFHRDTYRVEKELFKGKDFDAETLSWVSTRKNPVKCVTSPTPYLEAQVLMDITREQIESRQKNGGQNHRGVARPIWLLFLVQKIANRSAQKENLEARQEARGDFHQRKLVNQRNYKNGPADDRSQKTHQDRKDMAFQVGLRNAVALCHYFVAEVRNSGSV